MAIYQINALPVDWQVCLKRFLTADLETIIDQPLRNLTPDMIIEYGQVIGYKCFESKLKYSQLRRYVDEIKNIEALASVERVSKIQLFRIPLLHGYSRQPEELKPFFKFIDSIIKGNNIQNDDDFENFVRLVDSITAHYEALVD